MHKKVMLILPDGSRRWGYATTEIPEKSDVPYITMRGHRTDDYASIVCNDPETIELLRSHGYPVGGTQNTNTGLNIPTPLLEIIKADAERKKKKFNGLIVEILKEYYDEKTD